MIIFGGGVSKKSEKWLPLVRHVRTPMVPATLANDAGIIGAALWARERAGGVR